MSKDLRPQTTKQARTIEVKTALPWTIIIIIVALVGGFITGWFERSGQMVTRSEITAEVMQQLEAKPVKK